MKSTDILRKYTAGEMTPEEANEALKEAGSALRLQPGKNVLTEEEKRSSSIGYYADQANGFGLLDTGTGTLDKVEVRGGELVNGGMGDMMAWIYICGRCYEVKDTTLVEV